jgi:hypothetical protein
MLALARKTPVFESSGAAEGVAPVLRAARQRQAPVAVALFH